MVINRWVGILFALYVLFSSYAIYSSINSYRLNDSPRLFFKDPNAQERITAAIAADHNMALIARTLHNKVLVSWQVFTDSIYRSLDIPFLFSLTERSALYDNPGKIRMLPPYELPFFFIALLFFVKRWEKVKRFGMALLVLCFFSVITTGLFWPFIFPTKLLLLMITVQLFIFIGSVGFLQEILWRKK